MNVSIKFLLFISFLIIQTDYHEWVERDIQKYAGEYIFKEDKGWTNDTHIINLSISGEDIKIIKKKWSQMDWEMVGSNKFSKRMSVKKHKFEVLFIDGDILNGGFYINQKAEKGILINNQFYRKQ